MSLGLLILIVALGGLLSYVATKGNKKLGAWITVLVSLGALLYMLLFKESLEGASLH